MKKFSQFIEVKAAAQANYGQQINSIFQQASTDIEALFSQLYKGTADMVNNYEKATLPEELQKQILADLSRIAQKVKGTNKMTDPRGPSTPMENVTITSFINNISDLINEAPSIVQNMGSHGTGVGGKKAYDFKSTLANTYRLVMDRMAQLKDAVFNQIGVTQDTHSKVLGLRTTAGEIRNKVDAGFEKLSNQPQPFNADEADKAEDSMIALANAVPQLGRMSLMTQDGQEIPINPRSPNWKKKVLRYGQQHKIFTLVTKDGKKEQVNMGNPSQVHTLLSSLGLKGTSDFMPEKVKGKRGFGLRGKDGKVLPKDAE